MTTDDGKLNITSSVGGTFPGVAPVFFKDNQRVAVCTAMYLKIYLLKTRQTVVRIPNDCTGLAQLYLSNCERIFFLIYNDGKVLCGGIDDQKFTPLEVPFPIYRILSDDDKGLQVILRSERDMDLGRITNDNLWTSLQKVENVDIFAASESKEYVVFAKSGLMHNTIVVINLRTLQRREITRERRLCCVAVSDTGVVAIGSPTGVIDIYYEEGSVRALKWHMEGVNAMMFSLGETYLISGGQEKVLVLWQLETDKKQFLPRLDGEITDLCQNDKNTMYGVTLGNKQLIVLSSIDLVSRLHVAGVSAFNPIEYQNRTETFAIHPGTRNAYVVRQGATNEPGCQIQVWNLLRDEQDSVMSLASHVQIGKIRTEQRLSDPTVTHITLTANGEYLISVDTMSLCSVDMLMSRHDTEVNLKFWRRENDKWKLISRISAPHGPGKRIVEICVNPVNNSALTAGNDGSVRLWKPDARAQSWSVRRILPGFGRNSSHVSLAWSEDSSVVALGFEMRISLIDARTFRIHSRLPSFTGSRLCKLHFVGLNLVVLSDQSLTSWDLAASRELWSLAFQLGAGAERLLAIDPLLKRIAIAVNSKGGSRLILFNVLSPIPCESMELQHHISALTHIPGSPGFAFIDTRGVINTVLEAATAEISEGPNLEQSLVTLYDAATTEVSLYDMPSAQSKTVTYNSFARAFDNSSNISVEALFDQVISIVNTAQI